MLSSSYSGTAHNTPADVSSSIALSQVSQSGTTVSGYVAFGSGLIGDGNFSGTVAGTSIQFLESDAYSSVAPLFFQGQIQSGGSMSGTYCSYVNNQCDNTAGGYGTWDVTPSASN
jgi:hypothetical protein